MGKRVTFDKAARKALRNAVSAAVLDKLGLPLAWEPDTFEPKTCEMARPVERGDCYFSRIGPLRWLNFEIGPRGLDVHMAFDDLERAKDAPHPAPAGMNPHSGKWNHYLWEPDQGAILAQLDRILSVIAPD